MERLLLEWGKSSHPLYGDKPRSKLDDDNDDKFGFDQMDLEKQNALTLTRSKLSTKKSKVLSFRQNQALNISLVFLER